MMRRIKKVEYLTDTITNHNACFCLCSTRRSKLIVHCDVLTNQMQICFKKVNLLKGTTGANDTQSFCHFIANSGWVIN